MGGLISVVSNALRSRRTSQQQATSKVTSTPAQKVGGVVVSDTNTGESVKTNLTPSGQVQSQEYRPAPKRGGGGGRTIQPQQGGEQETLAIVNSQSEILNEQVREQAPSNPNAGRITPTKNTGIQSQAPTPDGNVGASDSTKPIQRYRQPIGQAFAQIFLNINPFSSSNTYQDIGQKGGRAYFKETFLDPFEYVGDVNPPTVSDKKQIAAQAKRMNVPYDEGTTYPFIDPTKFDTYTRRNRELYNQAGVAYQGEPAELLPGKIGDKVVSEKKIEYEAKLNQQEEALTNYYQRRINEGADFTATSAEYKIASARLASQISSQYEGDVQRTYASRVPTDLNRRISDINTFKAQSFEPPVQRDIRQGLPILETGALIAASAVGGSGVSLAVSGYLTARTFADTVKYESNYSQYTTREKIIGGAGLALEAAGAVGSFNLGIKQYYSEYRSIVYNELANKQSVVFGRETLNQEGATYSITAERRYGVNRAYDISSTNVYQTGENRVGFFGKQKSYTRIFDPETEKFITTRSSYSFGGNVGRIKEDLLNINGINVNQNSAQAGVGNAYYINKATGARKDLLFTPLTQEQAGYYNVGSGNIKSAKASPVPSYANSGGYGYDFTAPRTTRITSKITAYGVITKDTGKETFTVINLATGRRSSADYLTGLYSEQAYTNNLISGGASAFSITKDIQASQVAASANELVRPVQSSVSYSISAQASRYALGTGQASIQEQRARTSQFTIQAQPLIERQAAVPIIVQGQSSGNRSGQGTVQGQTQAQGFVNPPSTTPGFPNPGNGNPIVPFNPTGGEGAYYFYLPKPNGIEGDYGVRPVKGGKRKTGYTPSFSALVFGIRGKKPPRNQLSKSGIDFRPITPGFRIFRKLRK